MRLMRELPELKEKIQEGALTLSVLSQAQSYFKREQLSREQKKELLTSLEHLSGKEAEKKLVTAGALPREKIRAVSETHSEVRFLASEELLKDLEKLKGLLAHSHPNLSLSELIEQLAKMALKRLDPATKKALPAREEALPSQAEASFDPEAAAPSHSTSDEKPTPSIRKEPSPRYVPAQLRRAIFQRDQGRCTYQDPKTQRRCNSTYALELDHIHPYALGGQTIEANLRLRCRAHNQLSAIQSYGTNKMRSFIPGIG